ncbi:hypothetical protein GCM10009753_34140 [Streptantibioticus ferralitis]
MDARSEAAQGDTRRHGASAWRSVRRAVGGAFGLLWCWAVLRVAVQPAQVSPVEQGFAVSGWTLGLLPVHVAPWRGPRSGRRSAPCVAARPLPTPRKPAVGRAFAPVGATAISAMSAESRTRLRDRELDDHC